MKIPYINIDSDLLPDLDPELKMVLEKFLLAEIAKIANEEKSRGIGNQNIWEYLDNSDRNFYFSLCPYCNMTYLLSTGKSKSDEREPRLCVMCGDSNPYEKIEQSLVKAQELYNLVISVESGKYDIDEHTKRTLQEQCLVIIATGIEVFLRDIYATILNLRYIKNNESLFNRFYKDSKNDFINTGQAKKKYINDLDIDLEKILGEDVLRTLNLLMLKRNVIVHNIGMVDKTFLDNSGLRLKIRSPVSISVEEINEYLKICQNSVVNIGDSLEQEFSKAIFQRMHTFLKGIHNEKDTEKNAPS